MSATQESSPGAATRIGVQTFGLLVDAYRELNAKKLFWITMVLSAIMVAVCGAFGLNERGLTFLHWEFPGPVNSLVIPPAKFYKYVFAAIGVPIWLTWVASILALVSTAGIFPDFLSGGAIELALSKPISRLRLFLTKYFTGLLFVVLQVLVFTLASFLVIGLRGHQWDLMIFLAVPIVVCFFSYLFCFCVLIGILTRSTIASILFTALFWVFLFTANVADTAFLTFKNAAAARVRSQERLVTRAETNGATEETISTRKKDLDSAQKTLDSLTWWHTLVYGVKTAVPKTADTVGLLERYLLTADEKALIARGGEERTRVDYDPDDDPDAALQDAAQRSDESLRERPLWWVLGTSLTFEGVVIAVATWIFVRRDF